MVGYVSGLGPLPPGLALPLGMLCSEAVHPPQAAKQPSTAGLLLLLASSFKLGDALGSPLG